MVLKDSEGLIFREKKKGANEAQQQDNFQTGDSDKGGRFGFFKKKKIYAENNDHIKFSVVSGMKLGIGIIIGTFLGLAIVAGIILLAVTQIPDVSGAILIEKAQALIK